MTTHTSAASHRGVSLAAFALAVLAIWALAVLGRRAGNVEFKINFEELRQSAVRNKEQLAHLLLGAQK